MTERCPESAYRPCRYINGRCIRCTAPGKGKTNSGLVWREINGRLHLTPVDR